MFKVVLVFSLVIWALVIAIIVSSPSDVRRTVQLLRGYERHDHPPFSPIPRSSMAGARARPIRQAGIWPTTGVVIRSAACSTHWLRDATPVSLKSVMSERLSALTRSEQARPSVTSKEG